MRKLINKVLNIEPESITRASIVSTISVFLGRMLGFVRQMLIAYFYGAKAVTDSFFVATVLPGVFTSIVGAIPSVLVPVFLQEKEAHGENSAWSGTRKIFGIIFLYLFFAFLIGIFITPYFVRALVPGFDYKRYNLAVTMSYALLPIIFFDGTVSAIQSIYNIYRIFSITTLGGLIINVLQISFIAFLHNNPVISLGIGYVISSGTYVLILIFFAKKKWHHFGLEYSFKDPMLKKIFKLLIPIYIGSSLGYLNTFVDKIYASILPEGSVSALNYALIIKDIPLSLFAVPLSQITYSTTALQAAQGNLENIKSITSRTLETIWLFVIPATIGFLTLPEQTVRFVYERGLFDLSATKTTAEALSFYTIGMIANGSIGVIYRVFFSLNDTKTPVKISAVALLMNILLNTLLVKKYQHIGLALSTSVSSIFATVVLFEILKRKIGKFNTKDLLSNALKISLCSIFIIPVLLIMRQMANKFFGYLFTLALSSIVYLIALLIVRPRSFELFILKVKSRFSR